MVNFQIRNARFLKSSCWTAPKKAAPIVDILRVVKKTHFKE